MNHNHLQCLRRRRNAARRGMSLLVTLFVLSVTSMLLLGVLGSETVRLSAVRNSGEADRAVFLAAAGINHALMEIERRPEWAVTTAAVAQTEFPAGSGHFYSATVTPGQGATYIINGVGKTAEVTRNLQVTIELSQ